MSDYWKCPSCTTIFEKPMMLKAMSNGKNQIVMAASKNPSCPSCKKEVSGETLYSGGFDCEEDGAPPVKGFFDAVKRIFQ